jgi:hypothetical protein
VINQNIDFQDVNNYSDFFKELSTHVYGNPDVSLQSTDLK